MISFNGKHSLYQGPGTLCKGKELGLFYYLKGCGTGLFASFCHYSVHKAGPWMYLNRESPGSNHMHRNLTNWWQTICLWQTRATKFSFALDWDFPLTYVYYLTYSNKLLTNYWHITDKPLTSQWQKVHNPIQLLDKWFVWGWWFPNGTSLTSFVRISPWKHRDILPNLHT